VRDEYLEDEPHVLFVLWQRGRDGQWWVVFGGGEKVMVVEPTKPAAETNSWLSTNGKSPH
jgi:hypothetical protein